MSTFRVNKNKNYTVMSNYHLRDMGLSLKAKGLLSVMLSLPETWDYSIAGLVAICKENETAVKSALTELKESEYIVVSKIMPGQTKSGRIEYVYDIYEEPQKQGIEKQEVEILPLEILPVENHSQLNTNKSNTKELNTDNTNIRIDDRFVKFVEAYPKPVNEYELYRIWISLSMTDELFAEIMQGLDKWKQSEQWRKNNGQYIANALVWLREKRWRFNPPKEEKKPTANTLHRANYDTDAYRAKAQDPSNYQYKKK